MSPATRSRHAVPPRNADGERCRRGPADSPGPASLPAAASDRTLPGARARTPSGHPHQRNPSSRFSKSNRFPPGKTGAKQRLPGGLHQLGDVRRSLPRTHGLQRNDRFATGRNRHGSTGEGPILVFAIGSAIDEEQVGDGKLGRVLDRDTCFGNADATEIIRSGDQAIVVDEAFGFPSGGHPGSACAWRWLPFTVKRAASGSRAS